MRKLTTAWDALSTGRIPHDMPADMREWHTVLNRMTIVGAFYWVFMYGLGLLASYIQLLFLEPSAEKIQKLLILYGSNYLIAAAIMLATLYWKLRKSYALSRPNQFRMLYLFLAVNSSLLYWAAYMAPVSIPFALLNIPIFMLLIALRDGSRLDIVQLATGTFVIASGALGTIHQITTGAPIIIPDYIIVWGSPLLIFMIALFIFLIVFYLRHEADATKVAINLERSKSEKLLLNILPAEVAAELKETGKTFPKRYNDVTIIFTDFVGFTKIAETLSAEELVLELDRCFSYFDTVCEKYNLEKLKTIGDAFMCAGGLPVTNTSHALDCALAALEIQRFMEQMKQLKEAQGFSYWELRLGMHSGPVVAGVVGEKKFAYDIWGDTVNTASRMESSGIPGRINISAETFARLDGRFACEHRGKVYAKNKGEIDMYFLNAIHAEYSVKGEGIIPNGKLLKR